MNRSLLYPRATTTRRLIGLDGMWRFSFDPESKGVEAGWALDLPSSLSMPVPASFCDLFTDKASREYCGDFWYETSFFVPAEWSGWDIVLRFGSVTHRARVFVNGVEVAQHEGGFLPFDATVTNIVRYNQFTTSSVFWQTTSSARRCCPQAPPAPLRMAERLPHPTLIFTTTPASTGPSG